MIELVVGGARSGKSRYAMDRALETSERPWFLATAEARDEGMSARIDRHKAERDQRWQLVEEPLMLSRELGKLQSGDCMVVDCLTLWLSNWLERDAREWQGERSQVIKILDETKADI